MVEMRDGLAHREQQLMGVELAVKQHGQHLGGRPGSGTGGEKLLQPGVVMRMKLRGTLTQAREWQSV
jgi:hypothetical protein